MLGVVGLEGQPVGSEAVIVEMGEIMERLLAVIAADAALDHAVELLFEAERGLIEAHQSAPAKK